MDEQNLGILSFTAAGLVASGAIYSLYRWSTRARVKTTALRGPVRESWLTGQRQVSWGDSVQSSKIIEGWRDRYGGVFYKPGPMGSGYLSVTDPRAADHILSKTEEIYHINPLFKNLMENLVGRGLIAADGASHKRQRKSISPGFTTVKIREYSLIFQDCAQKLASKWDHVLDSADSDTIDIQKWFGAYSLDTIGMAGFSHDFRSLDGIKSPVAQAFEDMVTSKLGVMDVLVFLLNPVIPFITAFPTARQSSINRLRAACGVIGKQIVQDTKIEGKGERSIMALLVKAESAGVKGLSISEEELTSQICTLIFAGYETTSSILTWIMIELARDPDLQTRVRAELHNAFPGSADADYETLSDPSSLPLLDAVVHEVLRVYPPILEALRTAQHDDVIPLYTPITLPNGEVTDKLVIAKGTTVGVHEQVLNRSRALWGDDAWEFNHKRWLKPEGLPSGAQEITGYRNLMTFLDGPKVCLGRSFAVTNVKVVLSVLLRRFSFDLPDGPSTKFTTDVTIVYRPKKVGADDFEIKMRIKRVES